MAHYKVVYQIDDYKTPHSRFYTALNETTALSMFKATCEESLIGSDTKVLQVKEIRETGSDLSESDDCCDTSCGCKDV